MRRHWGSWRIFRHGNHEARTLHTSLHMPPHYILLSSVSPDRYTPVTTKLPSSLYRSVHRANERGTAMSLTSNYSIGPHWGSRHFTALSRIFPKHDVERKVVSHVSSSPTGASTTHVFTNHRHRKTDGKMANKEAQDAATPRVFIVRHGQTEWSQSGQYTGKTDIPLTSHGEDQVKATGQIAYGKGKLIDPAKIAKVYVSPRTRAKKTYELLSGKTDGYEVSESLAEWDYGYVKEMFPRALLDPAQLTEAECHSPASTKVSKPPRSAPCAPPTISTPLDPGTSGATVAKAARLQLKSQNVSTVSSPKSNIFMRPE